MKQSLLIGLISAAIWTALGLLFGTLIWWQAIAFALFMMLVESTLRHRHRRK